ncbi:DUF6886 family protein [Yoonia sp. 2307UL14-13]|uniref:DUF6886 family protein n=1 Tax=Yoonia sp. 2307UL14-13 TaxID=3126506 RepID=UPI0030AF31A7
MTYSDKHTTTLYHFSDVGDITEFVPRRVVRDRPPGREWLNGPLVWAINEAYDFLYLFPRDCPRIVVWATERTHVDDRCRWLGRADRAAYFQTHWAGAISRATLWRYTLPADSFTMLGDVGMAVSKEVVKPIQKHRLTSLRTLLKARKVALRPISDINAMTDLFETSLHVSAIRLGNAR